jgi:hypothetical protein
MVLPWTQSAGVWVASEVAGVFVVSVAVELS